MRRKLQLTPEKEKNLDKFMKVIDLFLDIKEKSNEYFYKRMDDESFHLKLDEDVFWNKSIVEFTCYVNSKKKDLFYKLCETLGFVVCCYVYEYDDKEGNWWFAKIRHNEPLRLNTLLVLKEV